MGTDSQVTQTLRVAFDIGGTFTDIIVAAPGGRLFRYKILTLATSVGKDVRECVEATERAMPGVPVGSIVHGTTVAANTVLERRGARTGLITTAGFRDELEIRRLGRPSIYNVFWERNEPLIPRRHRLEVRGRLTVDGEEDEPLDLQGVEAALVRLRDEEVEALAIAFIHAYANPAHEQAALTLAKSMLPNIPICTSGDVLPEVREYERTSTTALNAYLMPSVQRYLDQLESELGHYAAELRVMQSNGGIMSARRSRERPVNMIESGPAAGVLAAAALANRLGISRAVSFDMGGTTAKACLIENGTPVETAEGEVGAGINIAGRLSEGDGYALRVPAFDIAEVGAGGGSLAWVDGGGALRVGPRSAGAQPGPAAYGRGGTQPTITDANVLLGFMNPHAIAGGTVPIDRDAAAEAFNPVCESLGLGHDEAAYGVHQVGNATMARAIRAVTTERGRDPREFDLIAFGGSGAIHALTLAESLGIQRVCVPLHPGLFSAVGLMLADLRYDFVQSIPGNLTDMSPAELIAAFDGLSARAIAEAQLDDPKVYLERYIDLRYARQSSELTLAFPDVAMPQLHAALAEAFHGEHERSYGYRRDQEAVGVVSIRVRLVAPAKRFGFDELGESFHRELAAAPPNPTPAGVPAARSAYFGPRHGRREAAIVTRTELRGGARDGPMIIEEFDTTIVVPPGWRGRLDELGNVHFSRNDSGQES
ncbi:MAG: N-methylhydantoinase A [Gammaproteobacteria bacterium]|jgi:N-methylhydantoinase A